MASEYLRKAHSVYVVAEQKRAVDDKTADDLLHESLEQQVSTSLQ